MISQSFNIHTNISFLFANHIDPITKKSETCKSFKDNEYINVYNIKLSNSITIFVKNSDFNDISFDENMGVGTRYGSSEEDDYVLQAIKLNKIGIFVKKIEIYHSAFDSYDSISTKKVYQYSLGLAHYWFKNRKILGSINLIYILLLKPIFGFLIAVNQLSNSKIRVRFVKLSAIIVYIFKDVISKYWEPNGE